MDLTGVLFPFLDPIHGTCSPVSPASSCPRKILRLLPSFETVTVLRSQVSWEMPPSLGLRDVSRMTRLGW